jgi:glycosyltransferase involved in cell wall biosynthesis
MRPMLHIAVLEPYYGGSHAAFAEAFVKMTRHRVTLATLPARKWKWRMRGSAVWFACAQTGWQKGDLDVIFCSEMLSVADLRAMLPSDLRHVPIVCYFHENQLTYPLSEDDRRDFQFGMTNITSCLAADAVWFNSRFHLKAFLSAADALLRQMPDFVPPEIVPKIRAKSAVHPPPVDVPQIRRSIPREDRPTRIAWPHRWEYDKNPEPLFDALIKLAGEGLDFELVLVGERFRSAPEAFDRFCGLLKSRIVDAGFIPDRRAYLQLLADCDIVVSSAIQENFGVAVVEAILAGCQPVLPNRLAYPEVIPETFHHMCLYGCDSDLWEHLSRVLSGPGRMPAELLKDLQAALRTKYDAPTVTAALDHAFGALATHRP